MIVGGPETGWKTKRCSLLGKPALYENTSALSCECQKRHSEFPARGLMRCFHDTVLYATKDLLLHSYRHCCFVLIVVWSYQTFRYLRLYHLYLSNLRNFSMQGKNSFLMLVTISQQVATKLKGKGIEKKDFYSEIVGIFLAGYACNWKATLNVKTILGF